MDDKGPLGQFWSDLTWSVKTSTASVMMVLSVGLSGGLAALSAMNTNHTFLELRFLALPLVLFNVGFIGTQRVWFLRRLRQQELSGEEIWSLTWGFFWRFVRLGLVWVALAEVVDLVLNPMHLHDLAIWTAVVTGLVADVALTFVVPALALSTDSVVEAARLAARLTARSWPGCLPYLLTPGITLVALGQAWGTRHGFLVAAVVTSVVGAVVGLWFKGAIVGLYVRLVPDADVAFGQARTRRRVARVARSSPTAFARPVIPQRMPDEPSLLDITKRLDERDEDR